MYVAKHSTQAVILLILILRFLDFSLVGDGSSAMYDDIDYGSSSAMSTYWPLRIRCTSFICTGEDEVFTVSGVWLTDNKKLDCIGVDIGPRLVDVVSVGAVSDNCEDVSEKRGMVEREDGIVDGRLTRSGPV